MVTAGPSGAAMPLTEVFAELGLRRPGSTAIDVDALRPPCGATPAPTGVAALADAVSGVCLAAIAFGDPQLLVLGGPWGGLPPFVEAIQERADVATPAPVEVSALPESPELVAARGQAVEMLRSAIVETAREGSVTSEPRE